MTEVTRARAPGASERLPLRPISYGPVDIACTPRPDGTLVMQSRRTLEPFDANLARMFRRAVERHPERLYLAERAPDGSWAGVTYESAREQVDAIAQALIDRGLSDARPVMILSGNAIEHALLMLACFTAAVPVAPVSVAYSLQSRDYAQLRHIAKLLTPGLVYVADTAPFAPALGALDGAQWELVAGRNGANLQKVTPFATLAQTRPTAAIDDAVRAIGFDTIAKFLFTSGSTGVPKAVINTHGMLASNQQALAQIWPFLAEDDLVLVDWLPWNHTFGGNNNFNVILRHAGTLYIDGGRPTPALIAESVRNLATVSPTVYYNVPAGYAALLPFLESDVALARSFFARLRVIFYAAAALPQNLWDRLETLAGRVAGHRIPLTSAWGATETAPMATAAHFGIERAGVIGVPVPGTTLKLVPAGDKLEVRVRGPNVTPGYWRRPDLTRECFDEEGYYRIGDAVRPLDPADAGKGLVFDGRIAEDFKLMSGTWVHVGALRVGVVSACAPAITDALVAGENRACVGLLAWLNPAGCAQLTARQDRLSAGEWARDPQLRDKVRRALENWNAAHTGGSQRVGRLLLLKDEPSIDAGEITDKGYINQRLALERRAAEVERLFADPPDADVIVITG
ncbi:MAG TPA: feruloyl-CoA synthase [Xanthobacteraceae bacterium]|nr:feruloyl-CoA synthase [Xanthobacteraceae bacterium]